MAEAQFKVNTQDMINEATLLTDNIVKMQNHFYELEKRLLATQAYWEGDAGDLYRALYGENKGLIDEMMKALKVSPKKLLEMSDIYVQGDLAVQDMAGSLASDVL